jgi:hypothetical protein
MHSIFNQDQESKIEMGPPFVFRFRPPNKNTLSELRENYIWFSDRDSLNDEFNSNPEFAQLSSDTEEQKLLYNTIAKSILDESTKKYFMKIGLPIFYKNLRKPKSNRSSQVLE